MPSLQNQRYAAASGSPCRLPRTGVRLSRSWRGFLVLAATLKQVMKHRKDLTAVADLAHRQRHSVGAQTLIQRPKRGIRHIEGADPGLADLQVGKTLADRQNLVRQQPAHGIAVRSGVVAV